MTEGVEGTLSTVIRSEQEQLHISMVKGNDCTGSTNSCAILRQKRVRTT